jgi:hypothetical protein
LTKDYPDAPIMLTKGGVLPANFQQIFADDSMLDVAAQLGIGPGIAVNAAWNLRAKMKQHEETTVPWHQDNSYWEPRIWDEHVMTVWVSLVDATRENGCMQFVRGAHKSGRTARHTIGTTTRTWYTEVSEAHMKEDLTENKPLDIYTAEVKAGTAIIFPGITPHRSLNSKSNRIRWSTDFRLHPIRATRAGKTDLDWFYGLKDSLVLRPGTSNSVDGTDVPYVPDWGNWANIDRTEVQDQAAAGDAGAARLKAAFDPTIVGPWMDLWNITKHCDGEKNRHVDRYLESAAAKRNGKGLYEHW